MTEEADKLFGTDGIRGEAGVFPLDTRTVHLLGQAAADVLAEKGDGDQPCCVIGQDTRESGDDIRDAVVAGLNSRGVMVWNAGVIPTPAVAYWAHKKGAAFGIVVSASHNPFQDNGIKFFGPDAYKLEEEVEAAVEERLRQLLESGQAGTKEGEVDTRSIEGAIEGYVDFVCSGLVTNGTEQRPLKGLRIALDVANGAACRTSSAVLQKLGAEVVTFFNLPDGRNINRDCGCTHPEVIEKLVLDSGTDAGVSHDGDADRVCLCDELGAALDGDELLAIIGLDMMEQGLLVENTVVATSMSNGGLDEIIRENGGTVLRTGVGDRQVVSRMREGGYSLGGEQSGHVIIHPPSTTGDGIVAASRVLEIMQRKGQPLSELRKVFHRFPQVQRNIVVPSKPPLESFSEARQMMDDTEAELGETGRVMLRYSGTEMLLRLLIEGRDEELITQRADRIEAAIRGAFDSRGEGPS